MLFGGSSSPDPKSVGKEARKEIKSGQHDIDRQVRDLERQEQKSIQDAKKLAKAGDMKGAKLAAGDVIRIRNAKQRMMATRSHLGSVSLKTQEMEATCTQVAAVKIAGKAMASANAQLDIKTMNAVMREFAKQSDTQNFTTESLDDLFDDADVNDEADFEVSKIFEELSISQTEGLSSAPSGGVRVNEKIAPTKTQQQSSALK